ncbi:transcriptional regulator [Lactiplantibacillus fabifermentans T30PCM01]|uniref:Transcriptional regulator n=1 Tax=Lactiplantibacillus fabifermentans T30PCM01 TaxID=1400520 RepID=W6T8F0_9LACO|nr:helix-turn-helix domain-containing protein [Lactiplantibacillus fabifermentans]ETY74614.1 transcriptional regulator [Lactiplantibacillus fabifermentans T30PCM01]
MESCPVNYALSLLSGKWKLRIVWVWVNLKCVRFNQLQRQLEGVSALMLSKSLKELEADHIVKRQQFNEVPPHVEYSLTQEGQKLDVVLNVLGDWGEEVHALETT